MRGAKRFELFENSLYIPEVIYQVRQNNDVELFMELGKIDPYSAGGLQRGQQMPFGAAYLEHSLIWAHMKTIDFMQAAVIPATHALPRISFAGNRIPMGDTGLLIGVGGRIWKRKSLH